LLQKNDILILLPAYNEATHLRVLYSEIQQLGYQNICIVNDGSTDETPSLVFDKNIIMLHHIINRGVGAATDTGLKYARMNGYKAVVTIDADAQHQVADIDILYQKYLETNADLIIGSRFLKADNKIPFFRKCYNLIANIFTRIFTNRHITDTQSGLKLFAEKALETIQIQTDGYEFCSEIIIKAFDNKLKIEEVPVSVFYTEYSMAKGQGIMMGFVTVFNLLANLLVKDKD
jgi:glycosyltransferase involved in cell wall biosynthesis